MIFKKVRKILLEKSGMINRLQGGFTLVELLVAIAITGLIAGGLSVSISQIMTISAASTSHMTAIKQVESAISIMRTDVIMSQRIVPDVSGGTGFPLTLTWVGWSDHNENTVIYSLNEEKQLVRRQEVKDLDHPSHPAVSSQRVIAENIESIVMNDFSAYSGGKITLLITAHLQGFGSASETRAFNIYPRPALPGTPAG